MSVFPFRMQHDAMQCGIACLQMVCEYHGRKMSAAEVEELCPSTAEGVSLLGMSRAAEALGLHTVSGRLPVDMLAKAPLPCILHWRQRHFVVLYRIRGRGRRLRYCVADPAKGLVEYSRAEFEEGWLSSRSDGEDKGIAMLLETTPAFAEAATGKRGGDTGSVRFLMAYVRRYKAAFAHVLAGLAIGSAIQLLLPLLTQAVVDRGIALRDIGFVWLVLAGQLMLTFSATALDFVRRWLLTHVSMRVNLSILSDFFAKLLSLPMPFFDTKHTGDLLQRMADHDRVEQFLTGHVLTVLFSTMTIAVFGCMLLAYYTPEGGQVTVGGRPLADYDPQWWRSRLGVVMQDGVIFSESVARNIAVGDGEIDADRLVAAARMARVDDFVASLPLGYDTRIGRNGMGLSAGQRQRILIARAVYKDPEYVFMDEATNSLDASNERAIVESLGEFLSGRTVLVIAHRLSTVRNADRIAVMDRGRIVECGTHEELTAMRGAYYQLVKNQLEL